MGSDNDKEVKVSDIKQAVEDAKAIKKSYDEIKDIAQCWKNAIDNAEACGGSFWQKAFNVSAYLDAHCHYDNDYGDDNREDSDDNHEDQDDNNSNNSGDSN